MIGMLRAGIVAVCLMVAGAAYAERVAGDGVNCRSAARQTARVVGHLERGDFVRVLGSGRGWSRVDPTALPVCWVRSDLLAGDAAPGMVSTRSSRSERARPSRWPTSRSYGLYSASRARSHRRSTARSSGRTSRGFFGGGSCPCSGGNVCIGPRGGRYCITSGGNKRYGV